ncbi:hypothetical protein FACS1894162_4820 [Bacteroidia bacterium]|nr:hypothetical protein FACS1894162_4820 [Bacteroidia bacterium]
MKMKKVILMTLLLIGAVSVNAQVRIGGTAAADAAAILDLNPSTGNTATKGLALPRTASEPTSATPAGMLIYHDGKVKVSTGSAWKELGSGTGGDPGDGGETPPPPPPAWTCGDSLLIVGSNTYTTALQADGGCWMTENLREIKYADDSEIANSNAGYQYANKVSDNDSVLKYGLLYCWAAATKGENSSTANQGGADYSDSYVQVQGVCPAGWHLPSDKEFTDAFAATVPAEWPITVFPGDANNGTPYRFGTNASYWSSSSGSSANGYRRTIAAATPSTLGASSNPRIYHYSIRCKKN